MRASCLLGIVLLVALAAPRHADAGPARTQTPGAGVPQRNADGSSARLRTAIERAAGYLGTHELQGDWAWFTTQAALLLGPKFKTWAGTLKVAPSLQAIATSGRRPETFPEALEARIWSLRWLPEHPAPRLSRPDATPVDGAESRRFEEPEAMTIMAMLLAGVHCDTLSPKDRDGWLTLLSTPSHSYMLTNQLFSLMLAYNQGCLSARVIDPIRLRLATQLFAQLTGDSDTLDELTIERLAILCYARVGDWISPGSIARLVNEQQASGAWGARDPRLFRGYRLTEEQTASLAFYVLARAWTLHHGSAAGPQPPHVK